MCIFLTSGEIRVTAGIEQSLSLSYHRISSVWIPRPYSLDHLVLGVGQRSVVVPERCLLWRDVSRKR